MFSFESTVPYTSMSETTARVEREGSDLFLLVDDDSMSLLGFGETLWCLRYKDTGN